MIHQQISSKEELIELIKTLSLSDTSAWENMHTTDFLEALSAWLKDAEGFYTHFELDTDTTEPSWQLFANALQAATIYE